MVYLAIGAIIIGMTLGLLGSGGSIMTVPILHYLLGHEDKSAIAESLAIVGSIALIGAIPFVQKRLVDWRSVIFFGIPGMSGTFLGASLAKYISGTYQLILFAVVMLLAAWMMLRSERKKVTGDRPGNLQEATGVANQLRTTKHQALWMISIEGLIVGMITGLVGVGGGFLIMPAMVILGRLPMRMAIGTSLVIIALQSLTGFAKYLEVLNSASLYVDWVTIIAFIVIGVVGTLIGSTIGGRINQRVLKRAFGVFLILMSIFVFAKEIPNIAAKTGKSTAASNQQSSPLIPSGFSRLE